MREIEFRGYVEDEQQWVYGYLMPDNRIYQIHEPKRGCCGIGTFSVVPESIGQYTGCRDINGIKIFENDIVKQNTLDGNVLLAYAYFGKGNKSTATKHINKAASISPYDFRIHAFKKIKETI